MAKNSADDEQILALSTTHASADNLEPLTAQSLIPKHLAVVGKGLRHNNVLLAQVLQADIQRWYPWSGLQLNLKRRTEKLLPKGRSNLLSHPMPDAFIGWGHKKSYRRAAKVADRQQLATLSIEDGFLRSLDSGISSRHGLSMVADDIGIYFDTTQSSRLEQLIVERARNIVNSNDNSNNNNDDFIEDEVCAQRLIAHICDEQLSKYNAVTTCPSLDQLIADEQIRLKKVTSKQHILLIDQVVGDASIIGAGADKRQFKKMLKNACRAHPNAHIWIKAHPAANTGYLTSLKRPRNVRVLQRAVNPIALLKQVSDVYTVSSHMGFEALMLRKNVHCFGVNWYSGWGLTDDSGAPRRLLKTVQRRRQALAISFQTNSNDNSVAPTLTQVDKRKIAVSATLETLFYSAYIDYSHYVDPATKQACDIETAIAWLLTNRHWQQRLAGNLTVYEFSRWKLPFVKAFIELPRTSLFIKPKPRLKNVLHPHHFRVDYSQPLLVWGLAKRQQLQHKLDKLALADRPAIYCMEDGFIRSNGLGATLLAPLSVVIDRQGIYYDATRPSDLEVLLRNCEGLTAAQSERVRTLQDKLLTQRVSKYNVGTRVDNVASHATDNSTSWLQAALVTSKRRLLIVGQVEDDLSVQHCGSQIETNSGLIKRVRQDNPEAYLIYKPHPDVEASLRAGQVKPEHLQDVQAVAYDTAMPDCLAHVDEVHTISSLTGFEALLRDLKVVCYGLPFYAGWGLTVDIDTHLSPKADYLLRRQRHTSLTLEQLLYSTLIDYPLYRLPAGYGLAQVEQVINYLYPSIDNANINKDSTHTKTIIPMNKSTHSSPNKLNLAAFSTRFKRQAATRFMQQRHRLRQRLRK